MIQGMQVGKTNQLDQALADLESTPQQFYLTGSRFFGNDGPNSDYDFFTQDTRSIRTILTQLGYEKLSWYSYEGGPLDNNCAVVYRKYVCSRRIFDDPHNTNIDIQLQKDVGKKMRAQEELKKSNILLFQRNKTTVHMLWTLVYNLFDSK
jgi:hypothetical protein